MHFPTSSISDSLYPVSDSFTVSPSTVTVPTSSSTSTPVMRSGGHEGQSKKKIRQDSETDSGSEESSVDDRESLKDSLSGRGQQHGRKGTRSQLTEHTEPELRALSSTTSKTISKSRTATRARQHAHHPEKQADRKSEATSHSQMKASMALIKALNDYDSKAAQTLIESGVNVNIADNFDRTPLILALKRCNTKIAQALIAHGANVNIANESGTTALILAVINGQTKIAQALIAGGANVNYANINGMTALIAATRAGSTKSAQALIDSGADVNLACKNGQTALMTALECGHVDIAQALIKGGALVNLANKEGWTALMWASEHGYADIAKALIKHGAELNLTFEDGYTALMFALINDQAKIAKALIEGGANVNLVNTNGENALILALIYGHTKIAQAVVASESYINPNGEDSWTTRMLARQKGHSKIIHPLIAELRYDETALTWALRKGHIDLAWELIAGITDVNANNEVGQTALILALQNGHTQIALALIQRKADVNLADDEGKTALMWALQKGYSKIAQKLIDCGAKVNLANNSGMTALMLAVKFDHKFDLIKLLIQHLDDVHPLQTIQQTRSKADQLSFSLDCAYRKNNLALASLLVEAGARQPDNHPNLVCEAIEDLNIPMLLLLLKSGGLPNTAPPTEGWPAPAHDLLALHSLFRAKLSNALSVQAVPFAVRPDQVVAKLTSVLKILPKISAALKADPNSWPVERHLKELSLCSPLVVVLSDQLRQARTHLFERVRKPSEAQLIQCAAGVLAGLKAAKMTRPEVYAPFSGQGLPKETKQQLMDMLDAQVDFLSELGERNEALLATRLPQLLDTCAAFVKPKSALAVRDLTAELMGMGLYVPIVDGIVVAWQTTMLITPKTTARLADEPILQAEFGRQIRQQLDSLDRPLIAASAEKDAAGTDVHSYLIFRQLHMMSQYCKQAIDTAEQ